jgi:hypothetical protein
MYGGIRQMKKWKSVLKRIILATFVFLILIIALVLCIEIKRIPRPTALNEEFHLQNSSLGRYYIDFSETKYLCEAIRKYCSTIFQRLKKGTGININYEHKKTKVSFVIFLF